MNPEIIVTEGPSILELLGVYPALLALAAVLIGISSIVVRRSRYHLIAGILIVAVGCFGLGITAWRLFELNGFVPANGWVDPSSWLRSLGTSFMATGVVLPACGVGLILLALAICFTKQPKAST
jgi:hypothetical protein